MGFTRTTSSSGVLSRWLRRFLFLLLGLLLLDGIYLAVIWPDWDALAKGPVPKSRFIERYEEQRAEEPDLPKLRWRTVPLTSISTWMRRSVVVAEDSRFWTHEGFDTEAFKDAMEYNLEKGQMVYGASTISQQTVKNMFLSASRDPLRKWHELVLTYAMEQALTKRRILEIYLNVAEFGVGVYGVDAAARYYWGTSAGALSLEQAVSLAATLPSPKLHNPKSQTRQFLSRKRKILRHIEAVHKVESSGAPAAGPSP